MVYGIVGFGDALILIPIIIPIIGIKNAVVLVNLWGTFPALLNFVKYRKFLDRGYFVRFLALGIPATILGTYLIISLRLEWIELIFGIFVFIYSVLKLVQYAKNSLSVEVEEELNSTSPLIIVGGFSYGLLSGLISASGPLNVALLEKTGHYRESFICNFAAIGTMLSISRIPFYFFENLFPYELVFLFLFGFPVIFFGTKLGQRITPKISVKKFQLIIYIFLLAISLKAIITSTISLIFL